VLLHRKNGYGAIRVPMWAAPATQATRTRLSAIMRLSGYRQCEAAMTGEEEELTTWTLGAIKSAGMVLEGACPTPDCNEFARFDLDALIGRFGDDWRVPATLPVRCSLCDEPLKFQLAVLHDKEG
jgi:hypothetical protein